MSPRSRFFDFSGFRFFHDELVKPLPFYIVENTVRTTLMEKTYDIKGLTKVELEAVHTVVGRAHSAPEALHRAYNKITQALTAVKSQETQEAIQKKRDEIATRRREIASLEYDIRSLGGTP